MLRKLPGVDTVLFHFCFRLVILRKIYMEVRSDWCRLKFCLNTLTVPCQAKVYPKCTKEKIRKLNYPLITGDFSQTLVFPIILIKQRKLNFMSSSGTPMSPFYFRKVLSPSLFPCFLRKYWKYSSQLLDSYLPLENRS